MKKSKLEITPVSPYEKLNFNMEWHYWNRINFFKFKWIIDKLNNLWYKHFIWEQYIDTDFNDWIWFFIDTKEKIYWKAHIYNSVTPEYLKSQLWIHTS